MRSPLSIAGVILILVLVGCGPSAATLQEAANLAAQAKVDLDAKNPASAIEKATKAIELDPNQADARFVRVAAAFSLFLGEPPDIYTAQRLGYDTIRKILPDLGVLTTLKPKMGEAHSMRGKVCLELGMEEEALPSYTKAIALLADPTDAYVGRAWAYRELGDYPNAIKDLDQAIAKRPSDPLLYANRGLFHFWNKNQAAFEADTAKQQELEAGLKQIQEQERVAEFAEMLKQEVATAQKAGLQPVLYLSAGWCGPCNAIKKYADEPSMKDAFAGTHLIKLDYDEWGDAARKNGFKTYSIPYFAHVDADGKFAGQSIDGGAWGENIPENMAPPLKEFFQVSPK